MIEVEREKRRKEKQELDSTIADRQLELERYSFSMTCVMICPFTPSLRLTRELESVQKVEREQQALISKLGTNE
jgi:hypothetical protein